MLKNKSLKSQFIFSFVLTLTLTFSIKSLAESKVLTSDFTGETFEVSVLSKAELNSLFAYLSSRKSIPFDVIQDGCFARTYLMTSAAGLKQISLAKRVVETANNQPMVIPSEDQKWRLRWHYHVAPIIYLKLNNGDIVERVIDPSLFDEPVSPDFFIDFLTKNNESIEVDTFVLPKFIYDKTELISNINMRKLDQTMLVSLSEVKSRHNKFGTYHEKAPYFDSRVNEWFQGGWPVEAP